MIVSKANRLGALISWRLFPLIAVLLVGGCKKAETPADPFTIQGVKVDLPKLQAQFISAGPELQTSANEVGSAIRYGMYPKAVAELEKLAAYPNLTEPQKKAVQEVMAQVKQLASTGAAAPAK
jgi:hypothetical protein